MSKTDDGIVVYRNWLKAERTANAARATSMVQESVMQNLLDSPAYQQDATRNGNSQPIIATRKDTKKCRIQLIPGDEMCIGDLICVFNEYWLCMELYTDELGMVYGEIWMCNHIFTYQTHALKTIRKYGIIDDGSYTKGTDKALPIADNSYRCYIALDDESRALYIDKRLAIAKILDAKGNEILEVGKISWIDVKSNNFGEGSHLMVFGLIDDPYNKERDNLDEMICDYKTPADDSTGDDGEDDSGYSDDDNSGCCCGCDGCTEEGDDENDDGESNEGEGDAEEEPSELARIIISGRDELRIGTERTYTAQIVSPDGEIIEPETNLLWAIDVELDGVSLSIAGANCTIKVAVNDSLIGESFTLTCQEENGAYLAGAKKVDIVYG